MKEVRGEGLKLGRSKRGFYSCFISQSPTTPGYAGGIEVPSQGVHNPCTDQRHIRTLGRRGERSSNHPQPNVVYPNKGRHIPFCLLIKSWLINQTSGSYTSLSFEGKALFSKAPSCKPVVPSPAPTAQLITPLLFAMNSPCLCQASSWTLITTTNA